MSNIIQPNYGTRAYSTPTKAREAKQTGTQSSSFLDLAARASRGRTDTLTTGMSGLMGMAGLPASLMMDLSVRATGQVQTGSVEAAEATEAPSLETMLKAKYPNIHYHVFDASSGYWRTRNDYPHYLLYAGKPQAASTTLSFADADKVSGYAKPALLWAAEKGIVHGKGGILDPLGTATRAEVAQMLKNFLK